MYKDFLISRNHIYQLFLLFLGYSESCGVGPGRSCLTSCDLIFQLLHYSLLLLLGCSESYRANVSSLLTPKGSKVSSLTSLIHLERIGIHFWFSCMCTHFVPTTFVTGTTILSEVYFECLWQNSGCFSYVGSSLGRA